MTEQNSSQKETFGDTFVHDEQRKKDEAFRRAYKRLFVKPSVQDRFFFDAGISHARSEHTEEMRDAINLMKGLIDFVEWYEENIDDDLGYHQPAVSKVVNFISKHGGSDGTA